MNRISRKLLLEFGLRAVLVLVGLAVLPHIFHDDVRFLWWRARGMSLHRLPYRDFYWEYPPLSLLPMLLAPLTKWSQATFSVLFAMVMAGCELASLQALRRHLPAHASAISGYWYTVGLPLSFIAWYRFDWPPVLFATLALIAVASGRSGARVIVAGFAAKLWPAVTAVALVVDRRWRQFAAVVGGTVAVVVAWYAYSPDGFRTFLEFRKGHGFQVEGVVGAASMLAGAEPTVASNTWIVHPGRWTWLDPVMTLAWAGIVAGVVVLAMRRRHEFWQLCGGLVILLLLFSRLLSPQFLVWPVPFLAVAWAYGDRLSGRVFALASGITLAYLFRYDQFIGGSNGLAFLVVLRNALLLFVGVRLLINGLRPEAAPEGQRAAAVAHQPELIAG